MQIKKTDKMKKTMLTIIITIIFFSINTPAASPPTINDICHFPSNDVSDDCISKEITSDDSVVILAGVYSENPQQTVAVHWNDGSEHSKDMKYSMKYWCYTCYIGQFDTGTTVTYYIVAKDTGQLTTTSDTYFFTVKQKETTEPNTPPIITIESPKNHSTINNSKPTIKASFTDSNEIDTQSLSLTIDDITVNPSITTSSATYTPQENMSYGKHTIILEVSDSLGTTSYVRWSFIIEESQVVSDQEEKEDVNNIDTNDNNQDTPGFEILILFFALTLILIYKKRNK